MHSEQQMVNEFTKKIKLYLEEEKLTQLISVGISSRHIHLSSTDLEVLFGKEYELKKQKALSQPGQFAAQETVAIAGPKGIFPKVRVLGPVRKESQVEVSRTDSYSLGINPPVRESGCHEGAGDVCVIGPAGSLIMKRKVIVAKRHIHMTPEDADNFDVKNGENVVVKTGGERSLYFDNVVIRVSPSYSLELHLDTDEANACGIRQGSMVTIVK